MFIGIDLGTSSVKSLLIDSEQNIIGSASVSLQINRPKNNWVEQNPTDWWEATCSTMDQLAASYPKEMSLVKGIGLSGQMHGAILVDTNGEVLRPAILWNDTRAAMECTQLEETCPTSHTLAGNIAMPGFTAPKLLWLQKHEPEVFEKIDKVLLPKDYLRFRLSSEFVTDMSDASGTLWLNVGQRNWSSELLAATGLTQQHMPSLVEGSDVSAQLTSPLQKRWGIKNTVMIAGGAGDNAATACGMGTIEKDQAFLSLGTSGVLFTCNEKFSPNTANAVHAFCHAIPETWHQMGVILSAADSLQWLAGITGKSPAELTQQVKNVRHPSDAIFLPYLNGERTPHNDASARGTFVGLHHTHDISMLTQTVLEGVAYAFKDCQMALREAGSDFQSAYAVGGGSKSREWLSIISAVLNRPLLIPASTEQGAALGAARLAIAAVEKVNIKTICQAPEIAEIIDVDPVLCEQYQTSYGRYTSLYPALKAL